MIISTVLLMNKQTLLSYTVQVAALALLLLLEARCDHFVVAHLN